MVSNHLYLYNIGTSLFTYCTLGHQQLQLLTFNVLIVDLYHWLGLLFMSC